MPGFVREKHTDSKVVERRETTLFSYLKGITSQLAPLALPGLEACVLGGYAISDERISLNGG